MIEAIGFEGLSVAQETTSESMIGLIYVTITTPIPFHVVRVVDAKGCCEWVATGQTEEAAHAAARLLSDGRPYFYEVMSDGYVRMQRGTSE
jgi:hypothetical protein